jgi:hypothetical protein
MHRTFGKQSKRAGIALAAVGSLAAFAIGTAQAQQFTRADISLDGAGNLTCTFRETGLGANSLVTYECAAGALGVVSGCFAKNRFVGPTSLAIFQEVAPEQPVTLLARTNGTIGATLTTEAPESGHGGGEVCTEPAEARVVAMRWCNASLLDVTNNILGVNTGELFAQIERTGTAVVTVPSCAELLAAVPPPEEL